MAPSAYEAKRLEQIKANAELLSSLGIKRPASESELSDGPSPKKAKAPRKKREPKIKAEPTAPSRTSSRLKRLSVDSEEHQRLLEEEKAADEARRAELERERHAKRYLKALSHAGAELPDPEAQSEALKEALKGLTGQRWPKPEVAAAIQTALAASASPSGSAKKGKGKAKAAPVDSQLQEAIDSLELVRIDKVVPERIYSLIAHSTVDKDLLFVGDKAGHLGVWDVFAEADGGDDEEDEKPSTRTRWSLKAHGRSSISALSLSPTDGHSLYSASYDCTIRRLNFETGESEEVLDADAVAREYEGRNEALISAFDITADGHCIWASDNRGGILHRDMRESLKSTRRWLADAKKIGCISLNPANENIVATAHLARDVRLFDVRSLQEMASSQDYEEVNEAALKTSFTHGLACSSAYWDPLGSRLLTTSYDSVCRVFNLDAGSLTDSPPDPLAPSSSIPHDNKTGRFTSVFKARWSPNPSAPAHVTVGDMTGDRALEVFSADGPLVRRLVDREQVTSLPAVTCSHPSKLARAYGGNSSGKVMVWAPAETD